LRRLAAIAYSEEMRISRNADVEIIEAVPVEADRALEAPVPEAENIHVARAVAEST
jgi:hypothetical protein